ncbi:MAG: SUMF1/EgtB/PvdO family nonheme iron enzyme [Sulfurovum sp.]|nr:SUMF1/EgtB/PvdO family nonheme iron enzyme [Sulfurovum sp.]
MQVMKANPSIFNTQKLKHHSDLNPVDNISFSDAQRFVDTLNSLEGRHNYRLPTEIEWEYASGDKEDNLSQSAWYKGNSPHHTSPVSLKKPNKWGLYDMLGNVWEWCNSPYTKEYNSTIADEYFMVLRGGSFMNLPTNVRHQNRMKNMPDIQRVNNGLRIVYDKHAIVQESILYTVQVNDTLSTIADKFYHNPKRWDIIFHFNQEIIGDNPKNIKRNQILNIPLLKRVLFEPSSPEADRNITLNSIKFLSEKKMHPFSDPSLPHGGMLNHILEASMKSINHEDYTLNWEENTTQFFPYLKEGKFDVGVGWLKPNCNQTTLSKATLARCDFLFSDPIINKITTFFKLKTPSNRKLRSRDFKNKRICRKLGWYTFDLEAQGLIPGKYIKLIQPQSMEECFTMLVNGQVDFVASTKILGDSMTKSMGLDTQIDSVEEVSTLLSSHFIVHKSNPRAKEIITKINKGMYNIRSNGKLHKIKMDHTKNFFYQND